MGQVDGSPESSGSFEQGGVNRRDFIILGITAVGVIGVCTVIGLVNESGNSEKPDQPPQPSAYDSSDHEHYPDQLTGVIGEGLQKKWQKVAVFPGAFLASPGAKFYKDVALTKEVDLGMMEGDDRTFILRPAFPGTTLALGAGVDYEGEDLKAIQAGGIDPDTFTFILPGIDTPVFGNYAQSIEDLTLLSRLHGDALAYTSQTNSNIPVQFIDIVARKGNGEDVIIPVGSRGTDIEHEYSDYVPGDPDSHQVIGSRKVTNYFALAQGRTYRDVNEINAKLDTFSAGNTDVVEVESDRGELIPATEQQGE